MAKAGGPVAIVDIGSNSVRLVVYEAQSRVAATLQNEKSICAIGRDMVTSGRLHAEGCAAALEALARFRLIADGLNVEIRDAVATAAMRASSSPARMRMGRPQAVSARRMNSSAAPKPPGAAPSASWRARTKRASPPKAWWRAFPMPTGWRPTWAAAAWTWSR
jgi:hypothetical protein